MAELALLGEVTPGGGVLAGPGRAAVIAGDAALWWRHMSRAANSGPTT